MKAFIQNLKFKYCMYIIAILYINDIQYLNFKFCMNAFFTVLLLFLYIGIYNTVYYYEVLNYITWPIDFVFGF